MRRIEAVSLAREADELVVADEVTRAVVQLLELVEVAQDERERVAVAHGTRRLLFELADERAPVRQPRQRIVVGEEPQLLEARRGLERRGGLVREQPQRLHLFPRRKHAVARVVRPEESLQRSVAAA